MSESLPAGGAAIWCEGLARRYGEVDALKPLDLAVPRGSIFGFLGRNGAGKTTTIRLLTGLARPSAGRAWVEGVETTNGDNASRVNFGYLPQAPAFYPWMTAREYLEYVARLFSLEPDACRPRVDEMLAFAGLTQAAHRRIGGFSGGMKQRLGIAQAFLHRPPVLFLDEPTSALDPAGRREVLDQIASLRGQVTVFLSSHILGDVERVCDHVGVIREGQLLLVARQEELLAQYALNIAILQVDAASVAALPDFAARLRGEAWVATVQEDPAQPGLRVTVHDLAPAKTALLPQAVEAGLVVDRFEWVRPSLEEVFLRISA